MFLHGRDAPTFRTVLSELAAWLDQPANANELIVVKLEAYTEGNAEQISADIAAVIGAKRVYTAADAAADGQLPPTPGTLIKRGVNVVFMSVTEPSSLVLNLNEQLVAPSALKTGAACVPQDLNQGFQRLQGAMNTYQISANNDTLYTSQDPAKDYLTADVVQAGLRCGLIVTFDRMSAPLLEATIWSWAPGHPAATNAPSCATMNYLNGRPLSSRWTEADCAGGLQLLHACVSDTDRSQWTLSSAPGLHAAAKCAAGSAFGAPANALENSLAAQAMAARNANQVSGAHLCTVLDALSVLPSASEVSHRYGRALQSPFVADVTKGSCL